MEAASQFLYGLKRVAIGRFAVIGWCCNAENRPIMHGAITGRKIPVLCPLKGA